MTEENPYLPNVGSPRLLPSLVCYADILGYKRMSREAVESGQGDSFLQRLREALSETYNRMREALKQAPMFSMKVFTDNIVVGYPVRNPRLDAGEPELGDLNRLFTNLQVGLAMKGFFVRGGIAYGPHYMDDDIVFGGAFLEAVTLDQGGGAPRLVLAPSARQLLQKQVGFYAGIESSPQYDDYLQDSDGEIFANYFSEAYAGFPDFGVFFEVVAQHKQWIETNLSRYRAFPGIQSKYEWAARYHNFVCSDFADRHPVPYVEELDEYASACEEAQKLREYLIDISGLAPGFSHISEDPLSVLETSQRE